MPTVGRIRVAIAFALWLGAAAVAIDAAADAQQSYRDGVTAFSRKQWQKAATAMRAAIAENPRESRSRLIIYGNWQEEYVPYYYLGTALVELRDCEGAIAAFNTSQQQGVTKDIRKFAMTVKTRGGCKETPEQAPIAVSPSAKEPAPAATSPPPDTAPFTQSPDVNLPSSSALPLTPSAVSTSSSQNVPTDPRADAARKSLTQTLTTARQLLVESQRESDSRITATRKELQRAVDTAGRLKADAPFADLDTGTRAVVRASRQMLLARDAVAQQRLAAAVDAYLAGRYEETSRLLVGARFSNRTSSGEAALFRAAARYALFVIDGRTNDGLKRQMADDLREYRSFRPGARPDPRVFAPPFIALATER